MCGPSDWVDESERQKDKSLMVDGNSLLLDLIWLHGRPRLRVMAGSSLFLRKMGGSSGYQGLS